MYYTVFVPITAVEVNYMDDVGQTLLNWASAFGTQEMVSTDAFLSLITVVYGNNTTSPEGHHFNHPSVARVAY